MNCHNVVLRLSVDQQNGIDTIAHLYSYNQIGKTIAVLGNGFHHIFPEENIKLYKKILDNDGLVVSEYPPDTKHQSKYFLERNRIVSGLSLGTLVIESAFRSGTSVTAKYTKELNKPIFCIPSSLENKKGIITNKLIKSGANLVTNVVDILNYYKDIKFKKRKQIVPKEEKIKIVEKKE